MQSSGARKLALSRFLRSAAFKANGPRGVRLHWLDQWHTFVSTGSNADTTTRRDKGGTNRLGAEFSEVYA